MTPEQSTKLSPSDLLARIYEVRLLSILAVLGAILLLVRLTDFGLEALSRRAPRSRFHFKMIASVLRFGFWLGGLLFILFVILAPTRETTLALLASIGIAVGLGAQDLVKNLVGGLVILTDRPYQLGDRVKIGDAYGEIDHIGLRSTKLTTSDDTRVTIPNSDILTSAAWNANSGNLDCQVVTELFLPPDTAPAEALEIGREAAYSSPYLLPSKPVAVRLVDRFQESAFIMLKVKAYVYDHRFEPAMQSDITVRAKAEFLRRGMLNGWKT